MLETRGSKESTKAYNVLISRNYELSFKKLTNERSETIIDLRNWVIKDKCCIIMHEHMHYKAFIINNAPTSTNLAWP